MNLNPCPFVSLSFVFLSFFLRHHWRVSRLKSDSFYNCLLQKGDKRQYQPVSISAVRWSSACWHTDRSNPQIIGFFGSNIFRNYNFVPGFLCPPKCQEKFSLESRWDGSKAIYQVYDRQNPLSKCWPVPRVIYQFVFATFCRGFRRPKKSKPGNLSLEQQFNIYFFSLKLFYEYFLLNWLTSFVMEF